MDYGHPGASAERNGRLVDGDLAPDRGGALRDRRPRVSHLIELGRLGRLVLCRRRRTRFRRLLPTGPKELVEAELLAVGGGWWLARSHR